MDPNRGAHGNLLKQQIELILRQLNALRTNQSGTKLNRLVRTDLGVAAELRGPVALLDEKASPFRGAHTELPREYPTEMALIDEAALDSDLGDAVLR